MTHVTSDRAGFRFSNLLVPTDLTAASDRVLGRVALLPLSPKARITLLHAVPDNLPIRAQRRVERDAMKPLDDDARSLAKSLPGEVSVHPVVAAGSAADVIASHSAETKPEMIVMGRVGGRALRESFLGSTAERVIRRTQLPVLAVRLRPKAPYSRPAIALDIDGAASAALAQLIRLLPAPRSPVTVIHAFDGPLKSRVYPSLSGEDAEEFRENYRREAAHKIRELLAAAVERAKVPPADAPLWGTQLQLDAPRLVIEKTVRKADTDLLVLGTRGRSGLAYAFLGSVAGEVLRTVKCDVLVVPPSSRRR